MRSILFRRDVAAWCVYDWANSAWITSIATVLLPLYFAGLVPPGGVRMGAGALSWTASSESLWTYSNAIYMLLVAVTAPLLGAMADLVHAKKRFLALTAIGGAALTLSLAAIGPGQWVPCAILFILSGYLWSASNTFYDAFLPELTSEPAEMDSISSAGYAVGYLGGGLMLALNVLMAAKPHLFGLASAGAAVKVSFVLVGLWWAVFTIPLLLAVREERAAARPAVGRILRYGFAQLAQTLRKVRRLPELAKFLLAFFLYNSGIGTIIAVAVIFAKKEIPGITDAHLVGCVLMIQFVGLPATLAFIWLSKRFGGRNSIFIGIAVYAAVVIYAFHIHAVWQFWVLGFMIGLVQGGTQAISRSLYGSLIPQGASAEFYGFFSTFNKVGPFLGPLAFAVVRDITGSSRSAILFLIAFFVLGFAALLTVRVNRGMGQARAFAER